MIKWIILLALSLLILGWVALIVAGSQSSSLIAWDRNQPLSVPRLIHQVEVQVTDFPDIAAQLPTSTDRVNYAAIAFYAPDRPISDDAINIQFSIERGELGLDWFLLSKSNIEDRARFELFVEERGFEVRARSMNGVDYVRVEDAEVVSLAASVVTDMYGISKDAPLGLYHEGFAWPPE